MNSSRRLLIVALFFFCSLTLAQAQDVMGASEALKDPANAEFIAFDALTNQEKNFIINGRPSLYFQLLSSIIIMILPN